MSKAERLKARLPRGFADRPARDVAATQGMIEKIKKTYELYGFEAVETPFVEFTETLGKFLPDQDRPNEGVFSFQDDDEEWLSLRYDLTAPLARFVAENFDALAKPYRSYRVGWVFRNEKPGPGRFRQFMQFDADTVGAASVVADAEMCMMAADTLENLGLPSDDYRIKVNNRKVLDGLMEVVGLAGEDKAGQRLVVLRAIDKLDRLGLKGVELLLGAGRKDESGDFTKGAGLNPDAIAAILGFVDAGNPIQGNALARMEAAVSQSALGREGIAELSAIARFIDKAGYSGKVVIDPSVVRGLEYYTGPVYEAELTFTVNDESGRPVRFGSVGGGGRYDGLVGRFRPEPVPATGFSIGVSRLLAALQLRQRPTSRGEGHFGPVVILVLDPEEIASYQRFATQLRAAGIAAEIYLGSSGMKAQMKYADRRGSPCVVIQGSNEREQGVVQIKDLIAGAQAAMAIGTNEEWKSARPAQISVPEASLVDEVKALISRHRE